MMLPYPTLLHLKRLLQRNLHLPVDIHPRMISTSKLSHLKKPISTSFHVLQRQHVRLVQLLHMTFSLLALWEGVWTSKARKDRFWRSLRFHTNRRLILFYVLPPQLHSKIYST